MRKSFFWATEECKNKGMVILAGGGVFRKGDKVKDNLSENQQLRKVF